MDLFKLSMFTALAAFSLLVEAVELECNVQAYQSEYSDKYYPDGYKEEMEGGQKFLLVFNADKSRARANISMSISSSEGLNLPDNKFRCKAYVHDIICEERLIKNGLNAGSSRDTGKNLLELSRSDLKFTYSSVEEDPQDRRESSTRKKLSGECGVVQNKI